MRPLPLRASALVLAATTLGLPLAAGGQSAAPRTARAPRSATGAATYDATIRWTSYGIPHVKANDWGSLGYGYAYATLNDAACTLSREIVMVRGELSRTFGPDSGNRESDVFHRLLLTDSAVHATAARESASARRFTAGYVAGWNRYLADHAADLPSMCRGAAWVKPVTVDDVTRLNMSVGIRYGVGRFVKELSAAAPPAAKSGANDALPTTDFDTPFGIGSNAVAMGKAVTSTGRGLLLGNPHYPWQGSSRFHVIHTTIPGVVDVMGVSLYSMNRVAIGFNKDVAWSHTVSTGARFTAYALELDPNDPTRYRYGTGWRAMTKRTIDLPIKTAAGTDAMETRTVWLSHYGPVVVSEQLPWTATRAYAIRDVNLANDRGVATYDALNRARTVQEVEAAIHLGGTAFVNTIAADRAGNALYADVSTVPNVSAAMLETCRVRVDSVPPTIFVLDGANPACEWAVEPDAPVPGAMPPTRMPHLTRSDMVSNSNDSYWLTNPAAPLDGFSPIIGLERTARSLRTRAGLTFLAEATAGGKKVSAADLEALLLSQRHFGAELLLDEALTVCAAPLAPVTVQGSAVDIGPSCDALRAWDRKERVDSRGAQVWREFWRLASRAPNLFAVPFDVNDPVHTPRGLAIQSPAAREAVRTALAAAQQRLAQAGIAPNATLGSIQYELRNGERVPIPGGDGLAGMWSVITTDLTPKGYSPIVAGNSYIQVVGWSAAGVVQPRAVLTYSQHEDPNAPHGGDLTRVYAKGELVSLPFTEAEILKDPQLKLLRVRQ
jgi:acyl-homoserine-lactone acylase